jgi:hypothetical protein
MYITYEEQVIKKLTCSHPKVKRIWEWGGGAAIPTDGTMQVYLSIILEDDSRYVFEDNDSGSAIEKAEQFLSTLTDIKGEKGMQWKLSKNEYESLNSSEKLTYDDALKHFSNNKPEEALDLLRLIGFIQTTFDGGIIITKPIKFDNSINK